MPATNLSSSPPSVLSLRPTSTLSGPKIEMIKARIPGDFMFENTHQNAHTVGSAVRINCCQYAQQKKSSVCKRLYLGPSLAVESEWIIPRSPVDATRLSRGVVSPENFRFPTSKFYDDINNSPVSRNGCLQWGFYVFVHTTMQLIDYTKIYQQEEPVFGHPMLKHFALDPKYINLNNGTSEYMHEEYWPFIIRNTENLPCL